MNTPITNRKTPSERAMRAILAIKEANLAAITSGAEFLSREDEARIIDLHCPEPPAVKEPANE
jgi:hypothetical protein